MKGRCHTEETKRKIGKFFKGRKRPSWEVEKYMRRRSPTSLEEDFMGIVDEHNLPYAFVGNGQFIIEGLNPDFVNTNGEKIAIEVYAQYYKIRTFGNIEDWKQKRSETFKKYGWDTIFFNETEVNNENVLAILER